VRIRTNQRLKSSQNPKSCGPGCDSQKNITKKIQSRNLKYMSKKRKLHQLIVTITSAYQGTSKRKEPFYFLNIEQEIILGTKKDTVYAFYNLVNKEF
jgi:hypothetical protein